ncbi:DUF1091 domain containing protein [Asbolus verrucosus]|uniref:DUF1091 domain containing protein n=1 Tax=Asbolus verrucosus TaxID=1661398 RepID=A0A482WEE2_ASBVE|nr:DUF1091 domain containing protein [Asbolus verrucosus]
MAQFELTASTTPAMNVSVTLLQDVLDQKTMVRADFYKLWGMEYKTTGTIITMRLCKFFERNVFGIRDSIAKAGNIDGCNFPKGVYYLTNFVPYTDNFPKLIPLGSYKVISDLFREDGSQIIRLQWYATVQRLNRQ